MARERIITALDLGSHVLRVGVLLISPKKNSKTLSVLEGDDLKIMGWGQSPARGLRRGQVIDLKEAVASIKEAVGAASRNANVKISKLVVGLGGVHVKLKPSLGAVAVSRADGEISHEDVSRVLESAQAVSLPLNYEVINIIPLEYKLDAEGKIKEPVGMKGVRLEAEVMLVLASSPVLKLIRKALAEANLEVESWAYAPLATARAVLSKKQQELGCAVIDLGGGTTSLSVWEESNFVYANVLPIGASHITNDVAIGLKIAPEFSEKVKIDYGCSLASSVSKREQVVLSDWGTENLVTPKWELARIIEARCSEIFDLVAEELNKINKANLLPSGIVLCGGGSKLEGLLELAKKKLRLPVELGRPRNIKSDSAEFFDPALATLAGLLIYGYEEEQTKRNKSISTETNWGGDFWSKIKDWLEDLMP